MKTLVPLRTAVRAWAAETARDFQSVFMVVE
jgi:hypothetical protein